MITYDDIKAIHDSLIEEWGEDGKKVFFECWKADKFESTLTDFLTYCTACGGNWGGMLLSGIKDIYPEVWEAIPADMGVRAWTCICNVLVLLGVKCEEE